MRDAGDRTKQGGVKAHHAGEMKDREPLFSFARYGFGDSGQRPIRLYLLLAVLVAAVVAFVISIGHAKVGASPIAYFDLDPS
jgi:hypothetical protein